MSYLEAVRQIMHTDQVNRKYASNLERTHVGLSGNTIILLDSAFYSFRLSKATKRRNDKSGGDFAPSYSSSSYGDGLLKRYDLDNSCQDYKIDTICIETADYVSLRSTERFKENLIDSSIIESMMACPMALESSGHSSFVWVNMCTIITLRC